MISRLNATALATVLVLSGGIAPALADEASELRAAVTALQKRLDQLESKAKEAEDTNDKQTDLIAKTRSGIGSWVSNFTWKGDFRYRNENIDQEFAPNHNRDRIRVRTGFVAKVNDTVKTEIELSTTENRSGVGDPRSPNQTLTGENSRKTLYIDLAYAEWQPHADWKFTGGKMKYPWVRPAANSYFFDSDINPEGLAVNYGHGGLFAAAFYNILEERQLNAETTMAGGQLGYRFNVGSASRLTLATAYFSVNGAENRAPFYNTTSGNGNTTKTTGCYYGAALCLTYGYKVWEAFGEFGTTLANRPLTFHVDYANNSEADNGLDTAYSAGVTFGRASDPRTWEIGYVWQHHEKDALFAQFVDSDFGAGSTDSEGSVIRGAYAVARGWTLAGAYMLNKTNMDRAATITGVPGVTSVLDRDYKRLQLDLNFRF